MALTLFALFAGSMALSTPPAAAELRLSTLDARTRVVATLEEHAEKTPTPLPKEWLDNASQTNGMLFGAAVLVLIIVGGTLSTISQKHRVAHPPRKK
jgi:hypothetical protein